MHRPLLWKKLHIDTHEIVYENPYFQKGNKTRKGCQIDYLVQTRFGSLYLTEMKFSKNEIGCEVIDEVKEKIKRLKLPKYHSIRPVLIHVNGVKDALLEEEFFAHIVDFGDFLRGEE